MVRGVMELPMLYFLKYPNVVFSLVSEMKSIQYNIPECQEKKITVIPNKCFKQLFENVLIAKDLIDHTFTY